MNAQHYDDIIIGGGKAGKTLAPALVADGRKTALVERSLNKIALSRHPFHPIGRKGHQLSKLVRVNILKLEDHAPSLINRKCTE